LKHPSDKVEASLSPYGSASSKKRKAQTSASPGATYFSAKQAGSQAVWDDATQDSILYFRG